jgi:hypothetical protein
LSVRWSMEQEKATAKDAKSAKDMREEDGTADERR